MIDTPDLILSQTIEWGKLRLAYPNMYLTHNIMIFEHGYCLWGNKNNLQFYYILTNNNFIILSKIIKAIKILAGCLYTVYAIGCAIRNNNLIRRYCV